MFRILFLLSILGFVLGNSVRNDLQNKIYNNAPKVIPDDGINLKLNLAIRAFNNIDQIDGSINMNVWFRYEWYDENLKWDPKKYNISVINLNTNPEYDNFIWTPDIYLYNTAEKPMNELDYTKANVYSNGKVFWSRPGLIKSTCLFDLTHFPFDQQECQLKFGSWTYDSTLINLEIDDNPVDVGNYQEHEEWNLVKYKAKINSIKYPCCENEYQDIDFDYIIRRKPNYYQLNIIIPTFATATLMILTLMVPWNSGERISFAVTVLLSIIVFLLIVSENLPKTDNKPLLSRMIIGLIYFSLIGVTFTIIISTLHNKIDNNEIKNSRFLKHFFSKCKYLKCCITNKTINEPISKHMVRNDSYINATQTTHKESDLEQNLDTENDKIINDNEININECKKLANNIEQLFILIFLATFVMYCLIIFLGVPKY